MSKSKQKESNDSAIPSTSSNLLARLDKDDLKLIKVAIRRHNIAETSDPQPIQRSLDDPFSLVIHRKGEGQRPIFQREGIVVNREEYLEERIILKSPGHGFRRSRSKSSESSRSRSRSEKLDEDTAKTEDKQRRLEKQDDHYERKYSRDKYSRSQSPNYRRSLQKYKRSRSPSGQRKQSPPLRLGEYRPPKHRVSQRKDSSPSPGPSKLHSSKYRSPSHRHSKSPDVSHRERPERERSPYYRRSSYRRRGSRSLSPPSKRKSRSPSRKYKRTPERGDSYRHSSSKRDSPKRSSYRRSPRTDRDDYRNSPERRGDRKRSTYRHSRNRSRSPDERGMYRGMHHEYPSYYDGEEYWFPSSLTHPGFIQRGFVPPMIRGVPRTMVPFPFGQPMFRPRPPIIYNQPYRPRIYPATTPPTTSTNTTVQSTISSAETIITTSSAPDVKTDVTIEEISETVSSNDLDKQGDNAQDDNTSGKQQT